MVSEFGFCREIKYVMGLKNGNKIDVLIKIDLQWRWDACWPEDAEGD